MVSQYLHYKSDRGYPKVLNCQGHFEIILLYLLKQIMIPFNYSWAENISYLENP